VAPLPVVDGNRIFAADPVIMQQPLRGLAQAKTSGGTGKLRAAADKPGL
jgi:hypothetical protein